MERTKSAARAMLELKYPNRPVTDVAVRLTVPIEIKYQKFIEEGCVVKTRRMSMDEVDIIFFILNLIYMSLGSSTVHQA